MTPDAWIALAVEGDQVVFAQAEPAQPEEQGFILAGMAGMAGPSSPGGTGGTRTAVDEVVTGQVARVSQDGSGLQLVGDAGWLNASKFSRVDLSGLQPGDTVELQVQTSQSGRRYIRSVGRVAGTSGT